MPHRRSTHQAMLLSRALRRTPTEAETKLWRALRMHQLENIHFRRQHAIGDYIVDFCSPSQKLVIEVDGSQHLEQQAYDAQRSAYLEAKGYRLLRFWNNDVLDDLDGVIKAILNALPS